VLDHVVIVTFSTTVTEQSDGNFRQFAP